MWFKRRFKLWKSCFLLFICTKKTNALRYIQEEVMDCIPWSPKVTTKRRNFTLFKNSYTRINWILSTKKLTREKGGKPVWNQLYFRKNDRKAFKIHFMWQWLLWCAEYCITLHYCSEPSLPDSNLSMMDGRNQMNWPWQYWTTRTQCVQHTMYTSRLRMTRRNIQSM